MAGDDLLEALAVKRQSVGRDHRFRLIDIGHGDLAREIILQEHLQAEEQHVIVLAAGPGLDIGRNRLGFGRILREMRVFVAVGIQNQVHDGHFSREFGSLIDRRIAVRLPRGGNFLPCLRTD